ncbi:MAG: hypothetical protein KGJ13_07225 [Patescibacteria group bacterium]|nr:hypothetical protein [Patescibacteria group bacterium]
MAKRVRRKTQHDIFVSNIKKLQRAGLVGKVDFRKKATPALTSKIEKYRPLLRGKATAVVAPDSKTAARLRKTLGLKGSGKTIVIPKEKGERYRYQKSTGEITSTRKGYQEGQVIKKTLGKGFPAPPEKGGDKRLYYTIPERTRGAGRLKRKTFGSFDEMLFYLSKYDVDFEDIEDRVEIEEVRKGSRKDKTRQKKIHDDRQAAYRRLKRRKRRAKRRGY